MASTNSPPEHHSPRQRLQRAPQNKKPPDHFFIALLVASSGVMLGISLSILSPESGPVANLKVLLLTLSASTVAYGVNRLAIERGTALAAIGYSWAMPACFAAMITVGAGMFTGAYSGLVMEQVRQRTLTHHITALSDYVTVKHEAVLEAARVGPSLQVVSDDLLRLAKCERQSSCVSGTGSGGYGPVAATLHGLSSRAQSIASAFSSGEADRRQKLSDINRLMSRAQVLLADDSLSTAQKRAQLQSQHAEVEQITGELTEALPITLLTGFTEELNRGVSIADRPEAAPRVNVLLAQHGASLQHALPDYRRLSEKAPRFPAEPGMLDALRFIPEFAAFAAVIFVAELVLPIFLWVLTYLKLRWEIEKQIPAEPSSATSDVDSSEDQQPTKKPTSKRSPRTGRKPEGEA